MSSALVRLDAVDALGRARIEGAASGSANPIPARKLGSRGV